jgi:hypothetical protein
MSSRSTHETKARKAARILHKAEELAGQVESWADFANALFDPERGFVAQVFPRLSERQAFFKTREYAAIDRLLSQLMERFGVSAGATPKESGKFVVRLPRTLRLSLEREAVREGVNLNQLVLTKLAVPLAVHTPSGE